MNNWGKLDNQFEKPAVDLYEGVLGSMSLDEISR